MKLDDVAVPCSIQFDPLSKLYLLLLSSNGAISLYGVGREGDSLERVRAAYALGAQPQLQPCLSQQRSM